MTTAIPAGLSSGLYNIIYDRPSEEDARMFIILGRCTVEVGSPLVVTSTFMAGHGNNIIEMFK